MQPRISIALATYNGERFIRDQIESLCAQTIQPYELVVSDDCSKDNTLEIIREFSNRITIKIIEHSSNQGVNRNFETAIKACKGDYIMICDQDDVWMAHKIQTMFDVMKSMEREKGGDTPILISSETKRLLIANELCSTITTVESIEGYRNFLYSDDIHCQGCTTMLNKAMMRIFPCFPEQFKEFPYDVFISLLAIICGQRKHLKEPLMYYRTHENNVSGGYQIASFKMRVLLKIKSMCYGLFGIPYSRQIHYREMLSNYDIKYILPDRLLEIITIADYHSANVLEKITTIFGFRSLSLNVRIKQIFIFILSFPFRLFVKP